jgi:signal transduction histidine kinase
MKLHEILSDLHSPWISQLTNSIAKGAVIRDGFQVQLERFYDLLTKAAENGDPVLMDPVLRDWAASPTQTDLLEGEENISAVITQMLNATFILARERLAVEETVELLGKLLPVFTFSLEKAAQYEAESRVAYISNDLTNIQNKLERLDRTKSNFIAVAAHELKTPLTLIEGYTSMINEIARDSSGNRLDTLLDGINNGIRRLQSIIDDMVDVSLIDNNLMSLNFQPFWIGQMLSMIRNELVASIVSRHQTLEVRSFPGRDQMLFGDPERIYQAFKNILSNAIKYTPDGGMIYVDGRILPGFVEVTVTDTGIGISAEDQETIFEKFGQIGKASLHSSGKSKFKGGGPGLGLPIARGIFEAHGGTIWVESPGHDEKNCPGSTFHILLPIRTEPPDPKFAKLFGVEEIRGK